ncbi:MAG: DUF3854 domain-containing protein [Acidobacteriota bacterium]|jgi:hypothetical protein|nr:DUF3854 domain-containing protein [Acidobacteriota bacterium]
MKPKQKVINLTSDDIKNLHQSFISDELIRSSGIYPVDDIGGAEIIGRKPNANTNYAGIVFPYFFPADNKPTQYRLRLDEPQDKGGKYLTYAGTRNGIYFVPGVSVEDLKNPHLPVILTEGPKQALALENLATHETDTRRFVPVGISGVWGWKGKTSKTEKGPITDFEQIELKHREVILIFDSDVATNKNVAIARNALAEWLISQGARVFTVDVPISKGNKLGIDDLLGQWQSEFDTATAVKKGQDLLLTKQPFIVGQLKEILLDGALTLEAEADTRGKLKITARDEKNDIINIDSFNPSDAVKRAKFAKSLGLDNFQTDIARALLKFADLAESISNDNSAKPNGETIETSFQKLKDGRIIEQISDLRFVVYNKENDSFEIVDSVTDKETGTTYKPIDDDLLKMEIGGIYLANDVTEYGTKKELIESIKAYVNKFVDLQPLYLALVSYYILFTYLFDKVLELSYVNATGDLGSGKSRFGYTLALASYRGYIMVSPTAATLYRTVDSFSPTLFLDEFNSDANSDDTQAVIQVLNTGFSKLGTISRQTKGADGNFKTETFNPYCPKIIGSYKASASDALKSRNIEIEMERSFRNDLPIRLTHNFLNEAQALRNKLIKFRLNEFEKDLEAKLDKAELDLRSAGITPRSVQINIPLYALIDDAELKAEFISLLQDREKILTESKRQSIDGEIVEAIHSFIFSIKLDENEDEIAEWIIKPKPKNLKLCSKIPIPKLTARLNNSREDYKNLTPQYIGRKLTALGLRTKKNWSREDEEMRGKTALFFDYQRLKILFDNFNLPYPSDFVVAIVAKPSNSNNDNGLYVATTNFNSENKKTMVATTNTTKQQTYANGNIGNNEFQDIEPKKENDREKLEI